MATTTFSDWTKMFGDFKSPAVDVNQLIAQFRRDAEALTGAVQILNESTQKNLRDLANLARSNAEHVLKASKDIMNHSSPENAASKHADFTKSYIEYNVNGVREIFETSSKATQEAFDVLSKRAAEKVKDFSDVAAPHAKKKAA